MIDQHYRVVTVSAVGGGGAGRAAVRLHRALMEAGVAAASFWGATPDGTVPASVVYQPATTLAGRFMRKYQRLKVRWIMRESRASVKRIELFSGMHSESGFAALAQLPSADIYHFHWINGLVDLETWLPHLPQSSKIVWTLHDMNAFTGGCHYDDGCARHAIGCGHCPQLAHPKNDDLSAKQVALKSRLLHSFNAANRMHIVSPSRWLAEEARKSLTFRKIPVSVVPNSVETAPDSNVTKKECRSVLGISDDSIALLFVCGNLRNYRKGFDILLEALRHLPARDTHRFTLLLMGDGKLTPTEASALEGVEIRRLGMLSNDQLIEAAFKAADIHLMPTRADNLPNTILESMACGTPTVGFDIGGLPDMVRPGETGELATPECPQEFSKAILRLIEADPHSYRENCKSLVEAEYRPPIQASRYIQIYETLLSK